MRSKEDLIKEMVEKWPSPIVARRCVERFSGGGVKYGTAANADSAGTGPEGRFKIGKTVMYPAESLARWIIEKSNPVGN